jgi:hypothetical protein
LLSQAKQVPFYRTNITKNLLFKAKQKALHLQVPSCTRQFSNLTLKQFLVNNTNLQLTLPPRQFPNLTWSERVSFRSIQQYPFVVRQFLNLDNFLQHKHFINIVTKQLCNLTLHQFLAQQHK